MTVRRRPKHRHSRIHGTRESAPSQSAAEVARVLGPLEEPERPLRIGSRVLPSNTEQMRQLSECYEAVAAAQATYERSATTAKIDKKALDAARNHLIDKVRQFTHPSELPLFDSTEPSVLDAAEEA